MQKAIAILEKNVEWIALGIGGLFLLFVVWAFAINTPVTVQMAGEQVGPSTVDDKVMAEADALKNYVHAEHKPLNVAVTDFTKDFMRLMGDDPAAVPSAWPLAYGLPPYTKIDGGILDGKEPFEDVKVAELPTVPKVTDLKVLSGKSYVDLQTGPQGAAALAAGGNGAAPAMINPVGGRSGAENPEGNIAPPQYGRGGRPVTLPPAVNNNGGGGNGGVVQVAGVDKFWNSVAGKFSQAALEEEYKRLKLPLYAQEKIYVEVQMERIETDADGKLLEGAAPTLVPPLPMNKPNIDLNKDPGNYLRWVASSQEAQNLVLQPPFYRCLKGDIWHVPTQEVAKPADQNLEQNRPQDGRQLYEQWKAMTVSKQIEFMRSLTPEQKKALYEAKAEDEKRNAPQRTNNTGRDARGGRIPPPPTNVFPPRRGGPGSERGQVDPSIYQEMFAQDDGSAAERMIRQRLMMRRQGIVPPAGGDGFPPAVAQQAPQQMLGNVQVDPQGRFDVWAHDETAQPGHYYRYRLRVGIKNPLYQRNMAANEQLRTQPYVYGEWSDWSNVVNLPSAVDIKLAAGGNFGKQVASFVVYRWQKGEQNSQKFDNLQPGDMIGGVDKSKGIDFTSGKTIVDIRPLPNGECKVRVLDENGNIEVRSLKQDQADMSKIAPPTVTSVSER